MWPKWWVHISQRRTLRTKRKKEKKNIHLWIFRWDHNKLHYNLWICALRWPCIGRGVFSCSEFAFQNMLLSLNDRREWNKTQIHVHAALDAPEFGRAHDQRLGNSRWCGIWKKERIRLYLDSSFINSVSFMFRRNIAQRTSRVSFQSNPISAFGKWTPRKYSFICILSFCSLSLGFRFSRM